ncbi:MAG: hypothetical protein M3159_08040, partial [Actinomycetota bacterium]|nr:hypothetical protein [Actinomycetota bacterium]
QRLLEILAHDGTPAEVIATKVRGPEDLDVITRALQPWGCIPFDPEVWRLEREGSLASLEPSSRALEAVRRLAGKIGERELSLVPEGATIHRLEVPNRRSSR